MIFYLTGDRNSIGSCLKNKPGMELIDLISKIKPVRALDVGCGCGEFTQDAAKFCTNLTTIDVSDKFIARCKNERDSKNIEFLCMSAVSLGFKDNTFDLVYERTSLHHIYNWEKALDEIIRVSSNHIILAEPIDDNRSPEKLNAIHAQELLLEIQHEIKYPHYKHLMLKQFQKYLDEKSIEYKYHINKLDLSYDFDMFFNPFKDFAKKSTRYDYWMNRYNNFKEKLEQQRIADDDILIIEFQKNNSINA
jgi:ubiquinone/menaquinone biosynthesis C-methylase UbiE